MTQLLLNVKKALKKLKKTVAEVHDIFLDLGNLVKEQGVMIDNIESNIVTTDQTTVAAHQELGKARQQQGKYRNKLCILLLILVIIAAVIVIVVFVVK